MNDVSTARSDNPWERLPTTHYVDNRVYCDPEVFEVEQEKIFSRVWKFACCDSEVAQPYDFRTTKVARIPLVIVRGPDSVIRAFVNSCSHRGAKLVEEPSGSTRRFECLFHRWSYDTRGKCIDIPREEAYHRVGIEKAHCGLKQVRCEVRHGFVFVNLDDNASPLEEFLGGCLSVYDDVFSEAELEVFHYHEQIVHANWKHWQETNMELYHEYLHVLNRNTGMTNPEYFRRTWHSYGNGHVSIDPWLVKYEGMPGMKSRSEFMLPGLKPDEFRLLDIFPDVMLNCRTSVIRMDTQIPIAPDKTVVQYRGLGVKGEPHEVRRHRIKQHAQVWGPFGRNLPEDSIAAEQQQKTMGTASKFSLIAREEDGLTQDDIPLRMFYREWERLTGLNAACLR